jgi:large conductance mechanosensitive channel
MRAFFREFKTFITKGNVMDLAVAVVIGAAFKDIVNSLVKDILTPVLSLVVGEEGFANYKYVITEADEAAGIAENAIYYGNFLQSILDFFVIALVIFLILRTINRIRTAMERAKEPVEEVVKQAVPKVEDLLIDIRELLRFGKADNDKKTE